MSLLSWSWTASTTRRQEKRPEVTAIVLDFLPRGRLTPGDHVVEHDVTASASKVRSLPSKKSVSKRKATPRKKSAKKVRAERWTVLKTVLTHVMAVVIPSASVGLTALAGGMYNAGNIGLAMFASAIALALISVSIPHLAVAIKEVTGSSSRVSVTMAVSFDCAIVFGELAHTTGPESYHLIAVAIMLVGWALSAAMNSVAFELERNRHG